MPGVHRMLINSPKMEMPLDGSQLSNFRFRVVSPNIVLLQSNKSLRIGCGLIGLLLIALAASGLTMAIVRLSSFADTFDLPLEALGGAVVFGGGGVLAMIIALETCEIRFNIEERLIEKRSLLGLRRKRFSICEADSFYLGFDDLPVQGLIVAVVGSTGVLFECRELVSSPNASNSFRFACWTAASLDLPLRIEGTQRDPNAALDDLVKSLRL